MRNKFKYLLLLVLFVGCKDKNNSFRRGFSVGVWESQIYSNCHPDYMGAGEENYLWDKYVPQDCKEMDSMLRLGNIRYSTSHNHPDTVYVRDTVYRNVNTDGEIRIRPMKEHLFKPHDSLIREELIPVYNAYHDKLMLPVSEMMIKYQLDGSTGSKTGLFKNVEAGDHAVSMYLDDKFSGDNITNFAHYLTNLAFTTKVTSNVQVYGSKPKQGVPVLTATWSPIQHD